MKNMKRRELLGALGVAAGSFALFKGAAGHSADAVDHGDGFPWTYHLLDKDKTAARAYQESSIGHCMYGAFAGVIKQLGDKFGKPYCEFPFGMMTYGRSGINGWGSVCGALNGAAAVIGLFAKTEKEQVAMVDALFSWYEKAQLPVYKPEAPVMDIKMPSSVSGSILCHTSCLNWHKASKIKVYTKQRKERCKRLTADVAAKLVDILNKYSLGTLKAESCLDKKVASCRSCHDKGGDCEDARGKMNCMRCHGDIDDDHF